MEAISALSFVNQSEEWVSNGVSMWSCNCQRPLLPKRAARCFACERIMKEDVSAELIPTPPFVSITLASAAMRHWGTDRRTIDGEEERRKEGSLHFLSPFSKWKLQHPTLAVISTCGCLPHCLFVVKGESENSLGRPLSQHLLLEIVWYVMMLLIK